MESGGRKTEDPPRLELQPARQGGRAWRRAGTEVHDRQIPQRQSQRADRAGAGDEVTAMTRSSIFSYFMSFVAGGCMVALVMFCARHPTREMLLGWAAYLLLAFALAYKLGGALIL